MMDTFGIVVKNYFFFFFFGDKRFINFVFLFKKKIILLSKYRFNKQLRFHKAEINLYQTDIHKQTVVFKSI